MAEFTRQLAKAQKAPVVTNGATATVETLMTAWDMQCIYIDGKQYQELWFNGSQMRNESKRAWEEVIRTRAVDCIINYTNKMGRLVVTIVLDVKTNTYVVAHFNMKKEA
jgi:hypothetical protein